MVNVNSPNPGDTKLATTCDWEEVKNILLPVENCRPIWASGSFFLQLAPEIKHLEFIPDLILKSYFANKGQKWYRNGKMKIIWI